MTNWKELKLPFRNALINAFNLESLQAMLQYQCEGRRIEELTSPGSNLVKAVDDILENAVRKGWLEELVRGAITANDSHEQLTATALLIISGITHEGRAYYQSASGDGDLRQEPLDASLHPYLEWVAQHSERLALSLLDPSGAKTAKLELAKVFINLHATWREWPLVEDPSMMMRERAALAAIHAERQLILLGDPGSGKSTLLRFLVLCLARHALEPHAGWLTLLKWEREQFPTGSDRRRGAEIKVLQSVADGSEEDTTVVSCHWDKDAPLPVMIELRDFARSDFDPYSSLALWRYVERHLGDRGLGAVVAPLAEQARMGNVIFLLDGVDEVPAQQRRDVWQAVASLSDGVYAQCRWVATCRVLSFTAREAPDGVPSRTLQTLTVEQITAFIENWYAVLAEMGEMNQARAENLTIHLQEQTQRQDLQELAQNPMLLTIMAIVQTYYGTLPEERARLYQACVETMLLRWQLPKDGVEEGKALPDMLTALGVNQQKLERLLWEIAWKAHKEAVTRQERADIKESEIMPLAAKHLGDYNKAQQFLDYTEQRAHLLVGRGGLGERVFVFPHRTFQEYLAACYLTPGMKLLIEAPKLAADGDNWREVLTLAAGVLVYNNNNYEQALLAVERMIPHAIPGTEDISGWYRTWLGAEMAVVVGRQNFEESDFAAELLPRLREMLAALLEKGVLTPQQRAEAGAALGKLGDLRPGVCTLEPDLITIPVGEFIFGDNENRTIKRSYAIARHPVTVAQFGMFMEAGGYEKPRYWGGEESAAWRWRMSEHNVEWRGEGPVTQPEYWLQPRWHGENQPIVGVSWYEAQAYCAWLTEKSGREYRLPTEEEWERAARHTDGREWAWGDEWEDGIINSDEAGIDRTTAVGAFPRGAAECGAQDMSGNVWEWTASFYNKDQDSYCVRGGSWYDIRGGARVAGRGGGDPSFSDGNFGFRVVSPVF